jgi:hypothetical protein
MGVVSNGRSSGRNAGAGNRARVLFGLLALLAVPAVGPARAQVECEVREEKRVYRIEGRFTAPVSPAIAWEVLSDYDRIANFVRAIRTSRSYRTEDSLIVYQRATAGVFPLRRTMQVELLIHETPGAKIEFEDLLGNDFKFYRGAWELKGPHEASSREVEVGYRLETFPYAVPFTTLGRSVMGSNVRNLLEQVRSEMMRRQAIADGRLPPDSLNTEKRGS